MGKQHPHNKTSSATSRERNRIHARKTRQRKKQQMESLQQKAEQFKNDQVQLKMAINEKNTANILCQLFTKDKDGDAATTVDPRIEALLKRSTEEIPDSTKLPALQPLILPSGSHHAKKNGTKMAPSSGASIVSNQELPDDGIDYELLGKDRSSCTPGELDQIRRERNRMHAKRTRDRKRLFMEEMAEMCKTLETENILLQGHLIKLHGGVLPPAQQHLVTAAATSVTISPTLSSVSPTPPAPTGFRDLLGGTKRSIEAAAATTTTTTTTSTRKASLFAPGATKSLDTLLQAATGAVAPVAEAATVPTSTRTYHPYSSGSESDDSDDDEDSAGSSYKRRRLTKSTGTARTAGSLLGV
ncbi:MAG: hypothetical protein SGILL_008588 [Bacillariaceae sp.]